MGITDEIKKSFKEGSVLTKIIYINIAVFILVNIVKLVFLFNIKPFSFLSILAVPADLNILIYKPWTLITYMFYHEEFFHILFNMLWFYWFAKIFLDYLDAKKLLGTYILGGIAGAIFFIAAFNILPALKPMVSVPCLGASAAVIAVVTAISFYVPNLTLNLIFIGPVKLKYIALISILLDILSISVSNPGGHIAHLGGALWGYIFIMQFKQGRDLTKGFGKLSDWLYKLFKPKPKIKVTYKRPQSDPDYNFNKAKEQERINVILDKISKAGYGSLTKEEKELLFKASNK
ncbi:MAG: rhomboid family intramembrane serine protease [Bacteroidia bacterium]|nr:rhomboid family intramembrane serine protease [Bacteroidia bacterium]